MLDNLLNLDKELFYFINVILSNPITDYFMPILTSSKNWMPIYIFLLVYLIIFPPIQSATTKKKYLSGFLISLFLGAGVALADYITAGLIKDLVGRLRPCQALDDINLLISCGPGKSFPSAHASNNIFIAIYLSHFFKTYNYVFYIMAFLVALSRVFVGVHYPLDIFVGGCLGLCIGSLMIYFINVIINKLNNSAG